MAKPEWMPSRLYQWVKPRSLGLHLAFLLIAAGCLIAMWWQVHRAMQGNTLSYLYSIEWPAFAVVAGIGWWLMVHDTPEDIAQRHEYHRRMRAASAEVVAATLPRSATALTVESQELSGRRLGAGSTAEAIPASTTRLDATPGAAVVPAGRAPALTEDDTHLLDDEGEEPADEMTEYNRYLALLALRGKAKTWRNPRGV